MQVSAAQRREVGGTEAQAFGNPDENVLIFPDPEEQEVTYTATLVNGSALPDWLFFSDPDVLEPILGVRGTMPDGAAVCVKVTATDPLGPAPTSPCRNGYRSAIARL